MKKTIKSTLSLFLVVVMLFSTVVFTSASSVKVTDTKDGITWTLYNDGKLVISGKGEIKNRANKFGEYDTGLNKNTTPLDEIKTLVINDGITSISDHIFFNAENLQEVEIADSVTAIGENAFEDCKSLKKVKLPKKLNAISEHTFDDCQSLESVVMPKDCSEIEKYAFHNCRALKTIELPKNLEVVGGGAFLNCYLLSDVTFPETLKSIGNYAFDGNSFKNIVLSDKVESIGKFAFRFAEKLEYIIINNPKCEIGMGILNTNENKSFVIIGYKNSTAEEYAKSKEIKFIPLDKGSTEHYYTSSKITKKATCSAEGEETFYCPCGYTMVKAVAKTKNHQYKTYTTPATTKADGSKTVKCSNCGIVKSDAKKVTIAKIKSVKLSKTKFTYNGKVQKPTVTVKDSKGNTLKQGTDYTVKYSKGCKKVGQYTVTVTFKGNYSGKQELTFKIVPKKASISKLTAGSKKFTVKWDKDSQGSGYEVQYSTSSKMSKAKTVTIKKNSTTSTTVKNLKSGKKYYVRVRTYKTVKINGKSVKLYSSWSKVKNIKTK